MLVPRHDAKLTMRPHHLMVHGVVWACGSVQAFCASTRKLLHTVLFLGQPLRNTNACCHHHHHQITHAVCCSTQSRSFCRADPWLTLGKTKHITIPNSINRTPANVQPGNPQAACKHITLCGSLLQQLSCNSSHNATALARQQQVSSKPRRSTSHYSARISPSAKHA
jgi:hypothetical protein